MIKNSIQVFLEKSTGAGKILSRSDLEKLNIKLDGLIPNWYFDIATTMPFSGLDVGWQAFPPEDGYDGIVEVTILDTLLLTEINLECYPGMYLWKNGYFTFGYGAGWAGNCFAFNPSEGSNPPVYEIWHDAASNMEDMLVAINERKGVCIAAEKFSEFFENAIF